jgi:Cu/Ag efflux protein CusF
MKRISLLAACALAVALAQPGLAAEETAPDQPATERAGPAVKLHGIVNSVNTTAGRVNITHDPVPALKWPAMKMNFKAADSALLKDLKPGMSVDFEIRKIEDEYRIVRIAPAN